MRVFNVSLSAMVVFAVVSLPQAIAQDTAADSSNGVLEEIVVTSRRYAESLQDVPLAVNALSNDYLIDQGITDVDQVLNYAPGGSFTQFNKMQSEYGLRGVSSQSEGASGDSSVLTVIDNVPVSHEFMKNPSFFDMQRVEILRGPQGTTFGRNASSGLIHLVTARPEFDTHGNVRMDVGDYGSYGVEAYVTGGLSDTVAGRLAVNYDSHDGYTEDTRTGADLGGEQNVAIRASLLFNPSDTLQIFVKAEHNEDDDDSPAIRKGKDCSIPYMANFPIPSIVGAPQPPWTQFPNWFDSCDPWETTISSPTGYGDFFLDRTITNLTAEVSWNFNADLTLTSVSGFMDGSSDYLLDAHGGPNNSLFQSTQNDAQILSQEFRVDNSASANNLRWLAGVYLMADEQTRNDRNIFFVDGSVADPQPASGVRPDTFDIKEQYNETDSIGVFGELNYGFTDRLSGSLGVRWSQDEKTYDVAHYGWGWGGPIEAVSAGFDSMGNVINGCVFAPGGPPTFGSRFCGDPSNPIGFTSPVTANQTWDNTSLKGSLQFAATDDLMVYGSISQGYKAGGFQSEPPNPEEALVPYDEETVTNFELGFKGEWGGAIRLNAALFFTDYEDLQLFLFNTNASGNTVQVTDNAADAEISGIEADFVWQATEAFQLSGSIASISSELSSASIDTDGDGVPENYDGTRPDNVAEFTATLAALYSIDLANGSSIDLRADWRHSGDVYDGLGEDPSRRHAPLDVFGLRATWRSAEEKMALSIWARNLTEEEYTTNVGPNNPNLNQLNFAYGAPRVIGATLDYSF